MTKGKMTKSDSTKYLTQSSSTSAAKSNKTMFIIVGVLMLCGAVAVAIAVPLSQQQTTVNTLLDQANAILDQAPVFDGHNDWPIQIRSYLQNAINNISLYEDFRQYYSSSHTDIPRLRSGKVGAQFWACFVPCSTQYKDAVRMGLEQMDIIKRMAESAPYDFVFARTAEDVVNANKNGKIASLVGVEGGHMIDSSLATLRMYYELGARYMSPTHSCSTPWAGSSGNSEGLSDFGKLVVKEMNRLGMLVDLAHVSDQVMHDALDVVTAPVIFSHSSVRSICNKDRNVPDDVLLRVKENKGVVMINFYSDYVNCNGPANTSDVADHYDYIKNFIGVDYIGIGGDYDGVPRVPTGLEDVSKYPNLIAELLMRGWTDEELMKITNGNILRVMREVERVATEEQQRTLPGEEWIPASAVDGLECRT